MTRFLAETGAKTVEDAKKFAGLGFVYSREESGEREYVFIKNS